MLLARLHIMNFQSIADWIMTRYYRVEEKVNELLYRNKLSDRVPPADLDLTDLLDKADRQNQLREILK